MSSTVIVVEHVVELPFTSVTVKTSVFTPTSEQTNAVWLRAKVAIAQLSELPLLTAAAVVEPLPVLSSCTVTFWQSAIGATLSSIVTLAEHVLELPLTSVTVRITVLPFTFAQLNVVMFRAKFAIPQASFEPLFTCEAVMLALPEGSSCTVMFWQTATGATLSSTVIVVEHVVELPFTSVTVRTSVFAPTSEQTNAVWLRAKVAIAQLSELPLFTAAAVVEPLPVLSSCTVTFWQSAIGAILSWIVTLAEQVLLLPFTSVTVKITVLPLTFAQLKVVIFKAKDAIPQASDEPLFT